MKNKPYLLVLALSILMSACALSYSSNEPEIEGITWMLQTYNNSQPIAGRQPTITFQAGQVSGTTGCNHYSGKYQINGESIEISELSMTEMGCPEPAGIMEQEQIFVALLASVDQYAMVDDTITFFSNANSVLSFRIKSEEGSQIEPTVGQADLVVTHEIVPALTDVPMVPDNYYQYQDSGLGITIYIPDTWIVTSYIEGQYIILQSYPEDKYIGGEMREEGDTKCDLNIHVDGMNENDIVNQWKESNITSILVEEEFTFANGMTGKRFEIDSMGKMLVYVIEVKSKLVQLSCFGDFSETDQIASTLQVND